MRVKYEDSFVHDRKSKEDYGWMSHWRRLNSKHDEDYESYGDQHFMRNLPYVYDSSERHHHERHQFDGADGCRLIHKIDFKEALCKIFNARNRSGNFLLPRGTSWLKKKFVYLEA